MTPTSVSSDVNSDLSKSKRIVNKNLLNNKPISSSDSHNNKHMLNNLILSNTPLHMEIHMDLVTVGPD